jgi:hypothetical protein
MENASLMELFEIAKEMFASVSLPEGSVLLIGSASYLGRTGTLQYAKSWTEVVSLSSNQWRGVRICPLIPFVLSECPGSIVRELAELATWFDKVYDTDPQGLKDSWFSLIKAMETNSTGMISLDSMDSYKVILPGSLLKRDLDYTATFCSNSSRPVIFKGLSKDNQSELLGTLLGCIYDNFRACKRPEDYLARADDDKKNISEDNEQKVFLVGASNLRRSIPHFADSSLQFEDVTSPGWTASVENIEKLRKTIETKSVDAAGFVFDILGNSSVRYEQFDGTTSLPFRSDGKYHLGGKVVTTTSEVFKRVVNNVIPIFKAKGKKPCVIVPPLPRYLFSRCCGEVNHCTNAADAGYAEQLMSGFLKLRNDLIKQLVQSGLTEFKVLDSCCITGCKQTADIPERLKSLRETALLDGIHFNSVGYKHLAERATSCLKGLLTCPTPRKKTGTYFWRGFRSPNGSDNPRLARGSWAEGRGGASRGVARGRARGGIFTGHLGCYHPYKRW